MKKDVLLPNRGLYRKKVTVHTVNYFPLLTSLLTIHACHDYKNSKEWKGVTRPFSLILTTDQGLR